MKKLISLTLLATFATTASAFDYKFNLEGRSDLVMGHTETTPTTGASTGVRTTERYNNFSNGLIRLNMMGKINDNFSYRFRYRFVASAANPTGTTTARENTTTSVDYLYVDHKNSIFTTRFGKQNWAEAIGRESFLSGTDVFLQSLASSNFKSAVGDYRHGVTAMFTFMETNKFNLAISNPNATLTDTSGTSENNRSFAMAASYTGSFFEKMFQPVLSYTLAPQDGDNDHTTATSQTKKGDYKILSAGFRSEVAALTLDLDYKIFSKENRNTDASSAGTVNVKEESKSIYANVSYATGDFTPIVTYINDKFNSATDTADFKRHSFGLGTFWKPMDDVNFRYHLMITTARTKGESATTVVSRLDDSRVYFGIKADI